MFQAQYQQEPVPAEGTLFKRIWIQRYEAPPPSPEIIQSWDTATALGPSNDYSVCTTWAKAKNVYYLLHVLRGRWDFPELLKQVQANVVRFRAGTVLVERELPERPGSAAVDPREHRDATLEPALQPPLFEWLGNPVPSYVCARNGGGVRAFRV